MERQKPTTSLKHNDEFSKALIESYGRWMGGAGFGWHLHQEETYPELQKKGGEDDFSKKDPKANAGAPDPAVDLRTGAGIKQSHGAEIKDTTKVVTRESCGSDHEKKEKECSSCKGKGCSKCEDSMKEEVFHEELVGTTYEIEVNGQTYIFEKKNAAGKEQGADGKACWKGYKYAGTEGGKDKCVKAGYEPEGEQITEKKLDPVGKEDKDIDNDGDHDKSDKYLAARRKKISAVIGAKKKMKEEAELRREIEEEKK
ncbi:MAG: hypothetical protein ACO3CD_04165 [Candidatus Nanopelagicaceae bacterium]